MTSAALSKEATIIATVLRAFGPWSQQVVIGGGFALTIYRQYLAIGLPGNPPVATRDVDTLLPRKIIKVSDQDISKRLLASGFELRFKDLHTPATEAYVKEIEGEEIEVEFLTDDSSRDAKGINVTIAGVTAQSLSYIKLSIAHTRDFQTNSGETGRVVAPGAWMFHKGLTFVRRPTSAKQFKDLYGIWYVASQLGPTSDAAVVEFHSLAEQNSKWFETLKEHISGFNSKATPKAWRLLEQQDPYGQLSESRFKSVLKLLRCVQ